MRPRDVLEPLALSLLWGGGVSLPSTSGVLYLGEALTPQMWLGCAVVLLGTALSLGLIGRRRAPLHTQTA